MTENKNIRGLRQAILSELETAKNNMAYYCTQDNLSLVSAELDAFLRYINGVSAALIYTDTEVFKEMEWFLDDAADKAAKLAHHCIQSTF